MPTIETYTGAANKITVKASPDNFTDTAGLKALSAAKQAESQAYDALNQYSTMLIDEQRKSAAAKFAADSEMFWSDKLKSLQTAPDFSKVNGEDGSGFSKTVLNEYEAFKKSAPKGNPYIDDYLVKIKPDIYKEASDFQTRYGTEYIKTNYQSALDSSIKLARTKPLEAEKAIASFQELVGGSKLLNPIQKEALVRDARAKVSESALEGLIEVDPAKAKAFSAPALPASLNDKSKPISVRQNNPLNIRPTSDNWQGKIGEQNGYVVFDTPENGFRAAAKNLITYKNRGVETVRSAIEMWAPNSENNTSAYVDFVSKKLGVEPDQKINLSDKNTLVNMLTAQSEFESGGKFFDKESIVAGVDSALGIPSVARAKFEPSEAAMNDPMFNSLDAAGQERILRFADSMHRKNEMEKERRQKENEAIAESQFDLKLEIAKQSGDIPSINGMLNEIDGLEKDGVMDAVTSNRKRIDVTRAYYSVIKDNDNIGNGAAIASGELSNDFSTESIKSLNTYVDKVVSPALKDRPQDEKVSILSSIVVNSNVVPNYVGSIMKRASVSANEEDFQLANQIYEKAIAVNPLLVNQFDKEDMLRVLSVRSLTNAGMALKPAIEQVRLMSTNKETYSARAEDAKKYLRKNKDSSIRAANIYDTWADYIYSLSTFSGSTEGGSSAPETNKFQQAQLFADYKTLFTEGYAQGLSFDEAKDFAKKNLSGKYAVSKVNGSKVIMAYAPEVYYGYRGMSLEKNAEWIRKDALSVAKIKFDKLKLDGQISGEFDPDKMFIDTNEMTKLGASTGRPVYSLKYMNDYGLFDVFYDTYYPDRSVGWREQ